MANKVKTTLNIINETDAPIAVKLNLVAKQYIGAMAQKLDKIGFKYHFVLSLIASQKNFTQQCLANCLYMDKAAVVRIIDYLTKEGLVKRETSPTDKRAYIIKPTAKAIKILPQITNTFLELNTILLNGFSPREQKQFILMINKMHKNISSLPIKAYQQFNQQPA